MLALRLKHTLAAATVAACTTWSATDTQAQTPAPKDFFGLHENRGKPLEIEGELAEPEANGVELYGGNGSWALVRLGSTVIAPVAA